MTPWEQAPDFRWRSYWMLTNTGEKACSALSTSRIDAISNNWSDLCNSSPRRPKIQAVCCRCQTDRSVYKLIVWNSILGFEIIPECLFHLRTANSFSVPPKACKLRHHCVARSYSVQEKAFQLIDLSLPSFSNL